MFKIVSTCKGGGYRYCRTEPRHPRANAKGLYPLHRVLMENKLGRLLRAGEEVHHKDENKENNSIENLELLSKSEHAKKHHPEVALVEITCKCGKTFYLKPGVFRRRTKNSKSPISCSRSCGAEKGSLLKL